MASRDRISGLVLLFLGLGMLWEASGLPMGTLRLPGPALMPVVLASLLGMLGLLIFFSGANSPRLTSLRWEDTGRAVVILAVCTFATAALERLGYRITTALLLVFLLWVVERQKVTLVLSLALGLSIGSYWLFRSIFHVLLPVGPLGF